MTPFEMVEEFHKTYGAPIAPIPTRKIENFDLRLSLLLEEASEYVEAVAKGDFIEQIDALADLSYVAYGALLAHGIKYDIKNPSAVYIYGDYKTETNFSKEIIRYGKAVNRHQTDNYMSDIIGCLSQIIEAAYNEAKSLDVGLGEVIAEVHRSNMSKLHHETGKPIYREDGKVLKGENFFKPEIAKVIAEQRYRNFWKSQPSEVREHLTHYSKNVV